MPMAMMAIRASNARYVTTSASAMFRRRRLIVYFFRSHFRLARADPRKRASAASPRGVRPSCGKSAARAQMPVVGPAPRVSPAGLQKLVAVPAHGEELWCRHRAGVQLRAQAAHVYLERAGYAAVVIAPDLLGQVLPREQLIGTTRKSTEQSILSRG